MADLELLVERGGYTTLPDSVWKHGLSARAIGILVLMLSKPPAWRFSTDRLTQEVREGRDAVRAAVRELEEAGFVMRVQITEKGVWRTIVKVAPTPKYRVIHDGKSGVGAPVVGGPVDLTTTESQDRETSETPTESRPAEEPRGKITPAMVEIAREAEEGTIRKQRSAKDEGRSVDATASTAGWPKKRPRTSAQRCFGIAERFRDRALETFPDEAMQTSTDGLYKTLRRVLVDSPGLTWEHLQRATELFWEDAASLHHPGVPVWKNFTHHLPKLAENARNEMQPQLTPDEWAAQQQAAHDKSSQAMTQEEIDLWAARQSRRD